MTSRKLLTLKEKMDLILLQEREKLTVRELAKRFNIGKTQASDIFKNRDAIEAKWKTGLNIHQKKNSLTKHGSQIDKLCYEWYVTTKRKGDLISGPMIQAKAKEIAKQVDYYGFTASNGWLEKWRKRNNIVLNDFKEELPSFPRGYKPNIVYSEDDNCLLFRELPDKSFELNNVGLTLNDPLVILSDSDEEIDVQNTDPINSYNEAFKQIARLKQFTSDDLLSLQYLNNLENRIALKGKQINK